MIQVNGRSQPERGDAVEAWLKDARDKYGNPAYDNFSEWDKARWFALDSILDEYRMRSDYGLPLEEELPEEAGMM